MENKIDIAKLLKDCPKGMELDCTMFENVTFEEVTTVIGFDDKKRVKIILSTHYSDDTKDDISLTEFGTYTDDETAKCVIFPKGKTTWEGFQRPFKDGDIVFYNDTIAIFKEWGDETLFRTYVTRYLCCDSLIDMNVPLFGKSVRKEIRFATEEEKAKLFQAIKEKGYYWNPETKTLEKLVESIEDTNDKVVMSGIYFDREYYADEVELHLNNYEIEIRDGKTYAIFKTETLKPEFKDGDVIVASNAIVLFKQVHSLYEEPHVDFYCGVTSKHRSFIIKTGKGQHGGKISSSRYATEEEKAVLLRAIKEKGYKWNPETKTLEKLPKFKDGDILTTDLGNIFILKEPNEDNVYYSCYIALIELESRIVQNRISFCVKTACRLATNDEKVKLFMAIKDNGYNWNSETKTLEKLPKFKVGDKIKDTRNNSEGIILKVTDKGFECRFEFGNFLVTFSEQDYFNLVPNKSDIILKQSYMEEINLDWCKQHGMTLSQVNVARDTSYYLETNGYIILVYTISTTGDQKLHVINPTTKKEIEFSVSRLNRDLNKLNSITTDDLRKLCELVNLDYPFKS
jgi:hypothetical protein